MKKSIIFCLMVVLMLSLVSGCTSTKIEKVNIYQMENFTDTKEDSLREITDSDDINLLINAFEKAKKNPGIADMVEPEYKVEIGEDAYFLWLEGTSATIMKVEDTHTTYSLSEKSAKEVNEVIEKYYQ